MLSHPYINLFYLIVYDVLLLLKKKKFYRGFLYTSPNDFAFQKFQPVTLANKVHNSEIRSVLSPVESLKAKLEKSCRNKQLQILALCQEH